MAYTATKPTSPITKGQPRKVRDLMRINPHFRRSVQIELDFADPGSSKGYVATEFVQNAFDRLSHAFADSSTARSWRITGDYGSGKSAFVLNLAKAACGRERELPQALRGKIKTNLQPIFVTGEREPLHTSIGKAIIQQWRGGKQRSIPTNSAELIDLVESAHKHCPGGILLILDELGKNLEHAMMSPESSDVYVLQRLAELASRSGKKPLVVIPVMKESTAHPPPIAAPHALNYLTEIALLKESDDPADRQRAEKLFEELLTEYEPLFRSMATKLLPFNGATCRFDTDDLYAELTFRIWENAAKFSPKETGTTAINRQFLRWASRILKNHVHDILASIQQEGSLIEYIDQEQWNEFAEKVPEENERATILGEILQEMDPDEAEIIRWYITSKPLDGSQLRTTAEDRAEICRKLNVTPISLRKRRQRALDSLRGEIESRMEDLS